MIQDMDRRRFLQIGMAAGAAFTVSALLPGLSLAGTAPRRFSECAAMRPQDMAAASTAVGASMAYLRKTAGGVKDAKAKAVVMALLDTPNPSLAAPLADEKNRKAVYDELCGKGLLKDVAFADFLPPAADPAKAPQPFGSATGSGWQSHHSYPGGLATHTAANMVISLAIFDAYREVYGFDLDRDTVVVSQMLHDLHKPWVFQWQADGSCRTERPLAGTGEHHVLGVAESILRGLPAPMVVAQACAHNHPGTPKDEADVAGWIKAAAIIAGVDPERAGLLAPGGGTLPQPRRMEGFVCHLGDHDYVLTVPAAKSLIAVMGKIAQEKYGMSAEDLKGPRFNALRNYVFAQATIERLYNLYSVKGKEAVAATALSLVTPA